MWREGVIINGFNMINIPVISVGTAAIRAMILMKYELVDFLLFYNIRVI